MDDDDSDNQSYGSYGASEDDLRNSNSDASDAGEHAENEEEKVNDGVDSGPDDEQAEVHNPEQLAKDRKWLDTFIIEKLKKSIQKVEQELDNIRNKKVRGAVKK